MQVHLDEAWQLLVRWPRSIRHLIQAKANEMRRCTDPVNLGPRPHMKNSVNAYKMGEREARELFDQVFRTQILRVMHEFFCVPQYTGWEDETSSYAERCGLFPRQRQHANRLKEDRREVNKRYDTDIDRF